MKTDYFDDLLPDAVTSVTRRKPELVTPEKEKATSKNSDLCEALPVLPLLPEKTGNTEHSEAIAEHLAERAAIQEYDGGLTKEQAAWGCAVVEALSAACRGLPIVSVDLHHALALEDIGDLQSGEINADALAAFARSLAQRMDMEQGKVPAHYTERATCRLCGPVWLWFVGEIEGCPWCWQRVAGRTIPRP